MNSKLMTLMVKNCLFIIQEVIVLIFVLQILNILQKCIPAPLQMEAVIR